MLSESTDPNRDVSHQRQPKSVPSGIKEKDSFQEFSGKSFN